MEDLEVIAIVVGNEQLGINLCEIRGDEGAFVESFYCGNQGEQLAAQLQGVAVGDRIMRIAGQDVTHKSLANIIKILELADRPLPMSFMRVVVQAIATTALQDARMHDWLHRFICGCSDSSNIQDILEKIMALNHSAIVIDYYATGLSCAREVQSAALDCLVFCLEKYRAEEVPPHLRETIAVLISSDGVVGSELLQGLCAAHAFLEADLARSVLQPFTSSSLAAQALAWMSTSPAFYRATLSEVLTDEVLGACYYLFLCHSGRQQLMGSYIRHRSPATALSPHTPGAVWRKQMVAVEAVRDGLLLAFYASQVYEAALVELAGGGAASAEGTGGPWRKGALQRIVRATPLPAGISIHRSPVPAQATSESATEGSTPKACECRVMQFTSEQKDGKEEAELVPLRTLRHNSIDAAAAPDSINIADLLPFCMPHAAEQFSAGAPRLISFTVTRKDGAMLYGASLVRTSTVERVQCNSPPTQVQLVSSPLQPASAARSGTDLSSGSPLLPVEHAGTSSSANWVGAMVQRGFTEVPQLFGSYSLPSAQAQQQQGLFTRLPLSPLLRAVGLRPPSEPPVDTVQHTAKNNDGGSLWSVQSPRAAPLDPAGIVLPYGVAVLTEVPAVDALRLFLQQCDMRYGSQSSDSSECEPWDASVLAELQWALAQSRNNAFGAPGVAADFSPQALYEALGPADLVAVLTACMVECKVVVVTGEVQSVALLLGEWVRQALYPLTWCHVYSPVVPQEMALELLQCPAPYFLGISKHTLQRAEATLPRDALVVDMETGKLRVPSHLAALLPATQVLVEKLSRILRPALHACDDAVSAVTASTDVRALPLLAPGGVVMACRDFVKDLLLPVPRCIVVLHRAEELLVALDEERFVRKAVRRLASGSREGGSAWRACERFVRVFLRAQCCSELVLSTCSS